MTIGEILDTIEQKSYLLSLAAEEKKMEFELFQIEIANLLHTLPKLVSIALCDSKNYPSFESLVPKHLIEKINSEKHKSKADQSMADKMGFDMYASAFNMTRKHDPNAPKRHKVVKQVK